MRILWDDKWILGHRENYDGVKELLVAYNAEHATDYAYNTFYAHLKSYLHFENYRGYTEDQDAFLSACYPILGADETTRMFNAQYGTNKSEFAIRGHCQKIGLCVEKETVLKVRHDGIVKHFNDKCRPEKWKLPRVKDESGQWAYEGRRNYEEVNGGVPDGYVVFHLDRDKHNNDPDNLVAIPKAYLMRMNRNGFKSKNKDINRGVIAWCELKEKIKGEQV